MKTSTSINLKIELRYKVHNYRFSGKNYYFVSGEEPLVVNFMGLDCTTYLETVVALTQIANQGEFTFEAYAQELELIRYQEGIRKAYPSRLHYFSDWIFQNQEKGILMDITKAIGGLHSSFKNLSSLFFVCRKISSHFYSFRNCTDGDNKKKPQRQGPGNSSQPTEK